MDKQRAACAGCRADVGVNGRTQQRDVAEGAKESMYKNWKAGTHSLKHCSTAPLVVKNSIGSL